MTDEKDEPVSSDDGTGSETDRERRERHVDEDEAAGEGSSSPDRDAQSEGIPDGRWAPSPGDMPGSMGAESQQRQVPRYGGDPNADAWRDARMGVEDPNEPDEFELRIPSTWTRGTRLTTFLLFGLVLWWVGPVIFDGRFPWWVIILLVLAPLAISMWMGVKKWRQPAKRQAVIFEDDHIVLPKGAGTSAELRVPYTDIWSVMVMMRGETQLLLVETEGDRVGLSSQLFVTDQAPRRIKRRILREIAAQTDGEEALREIRQREDNARAASDMPTSATYALLFGLAGIYLYQYASGALSDQFQLLNLGANSAVLVDAGQWWRLISANFLHGGFLHIFLNGIALLFLGLTLERLLGSWRFVLLYLVSALGGAIGSYYWTQAHLSVGSSTAIFGLLGAFLVVHLKFWRQLPPPFRQTKTWWVVILTLNIGFSFVPFVDAGGHFGGLFTGMIVAGLMLWPANQLDPTSTAGGGVRLTTAILSVLFIFGLAQAGLYAQDPHPEDVRMVYDARIQQAVDNENSYELNAIAWNIAIDEESGREQLEMARRASERAVELNADRFSYRDTYSTVLYRLALKSSGEQRRELLGEAIETQHRVFKESTRSSEPTIDYWRDYMAYLSGEQDPVYASQLARFLEAYVNEFDVYRFGELPEDELNVSVESGGDDGSYLRVGVDAPTNEAMLAYVLTLKEKDRTGLARFCLPEGFRERKINSLRNEGASKESGFPDEWHARLAATDTRVDSCPKDAPANRFWPSARQIQNLP